MYKFINDLSIFVRMIKYFILIALVLLVGCSSQETIVESAPVEDVDEQAEKPSNDIIQDGRYKINTDVSELIWKSNRIAGSSHVGNVQVSIGSLEVLNGGFTKGNFVLDMSTISEDKNNERFLSHLRSEDFFDVVNYPMSGFVIKSMIKNGKDYDVIGDLTILDKTNEISFVVAITKVGTGLNAKTDFEIDRTKWGITYDSGTFFQKLGDRAIKDEIYFDLDLVFDKE
jgi:polyisoprenoid-binding protein YceI